METGMEKFMEKRNNTKCAITHKKSVNQRSKFVLFVWFFGYNFWIENVWPKTQLHLDSTYQGALNDIL